MKVTRRDFLKTAATVGAAAAIKLHKQDLIEVFAQAPDYWHICWLNAASCTGCEVSFVQHANPDVIEILTSITVGDSGLPIALPDYMQVIHPTSGKLALELIDVWKAGSEKRKVLIVVGAVQSPGFCEVGDRDFRDLLADVAPHADYVIAFGSCSAFGGIPHAKNNVTGAMGVADFFEEAGIAKTVINLPRCPGHPDSLVLTLASVMVGVIPALDAHGRPKAFFGTNMHDQLCPYRPYYDRGIFIPKVGEYVDDEEGGCRFKIGCKGPITYTDCALVKWNNHVSYCVQVGAPCIGCAQPEFPDGDTAPFWKELPTLPTVLGIPAQTWGQALVAISVIGCAAHFARKVVTKR